MNSADRYTALIRATLTTALDTTALRTDSLALAMDYVRHAVGVAGPDLGRPDPQSLVGMRYRDGAGHSRPLYRGLTLYALGRVGPLPPGTLEALSETTAREFEDFLSSGAPPRASDGAAVVRLAFDALALCAVSDQDDVARSVLKAIAERQQADGPFLLRSSSDNPEPAWYHELALLHAVTTYACRSGDPAARAASLRAATYQSEQIQPDHASSHPFALHAFLRSVNGTYLADMMLHAAGVQQPSTMDTVSLLLLADALDCMQHGDWGE